MYLDLDLDEDIDLVLILHNIIRHKVFSDTYRVNVLSFFNFSVAWNTDPQNHADITKSQFLTEQVKHALRTKSMSQTS